jgi:hypothetical protein
MRDFLEQELRVGQRVAYLHSVGLNRPNILREGIVEDILEGGLVNIRSCETDRLISRYNTLIVGGQDERN